jgi:hypothetical protein
MVIAFSPELRRLAPGEMYSSSPASYEDTLFQFGVVPRGRYDMIVFFDTEPLITDRRHCGRFNLRGYILPLFVGVRGRHVVFQRLAQPEDVRDGLADMGYSLVRHVGTLQQSIALLCAGIHLRHEFFSPRYQSTVLRSLMADGSLWL